MLQCWLWPCARFRPQLSHEEWNQEAAAKQPNIESANSESSNADSGKTSYTALPTLPMHQHRAPYPEHSSMLQDLPLKSVLLAHSSHESSSFGACGCWRQKRVQGDLAPDISRSTHQQPGDTAPPTLCWGTEGKQTFQGCFLHSGTFSAFLGFMPTHELFLSSLL